MDKSGSNVQRVYSVTLSRSFLRFGTRVNRERREDAEGVSLLRIMGLAGITCVVQRQGTHSGEVCHCLAELQAEQENHGVEEWLPAILAVVAGRVLAQILLKVYEHKDKRAHRLCVTP